MVGLPEAGQMGQLGGIDHDGGQVVNLGLPLGQPRELAPPGFLLRPDPLLVRGDRSPDAGEVDPWGRRPERPDLGSGRVAPGERPPGGATRAAEPVEGVGPRDGTDLSWAAYETYRTGNRGVRGGFRRFCRCFRRGIL